MAGGVDDVDLVVFPEAGNRGGRNRDAALFFLVHPVGGGSTIVGFTDFAVDTRVVEDSFGYGGLSGIDVGHDADVADLMKVRKHFLCHCVPQLVVWWPTHRNQSIVAMLVAIRWWRACV